MATPEHDMECAGRREQPAPLLTRQASLGEDVREELAGESASEDRPALGFASHS
jgi:hypothetical protein